MKEYGKLSDKEFQELQKEHGTVYTIDVLFELEEKREEHNKLLGQFEKALAKDNTEQTDKIEQQLKEIEKDLYIVLYGYIKKPGRSTLGLALSMYDRDPLKAKEVILEKSWLKGDERIKTNDDAFLSASTVIGEFLTVGKAGLKKNQTILIRSK